MKHLFEKKYSIYLVASILSVLITLISSYTSDFNINLDGILYLRVANVYLEQGFSAAFAIYPWPFYSILVAMLSQITSLSTSMSAFIINNILQIIIVVYFLQIIKKLGATQRIQWLSLLVILAFPQLNDYRHYIIRDFGFWAFYLVALYHFLCFSKAGEWRHVIMWNLALVISCLFRLEGGIFLAIIPFSLFFMTNYSVKHRFQLFIKVYSFVLIATLFVTILSIIYQSFYLFEFGKIHQFVDTASRTLIIIERKFNLAVAGLRDKALTHPAMKGAPIIVGSGLIGLYLFKLITSLSILYSILSAYSMFGKKMKASAESNIVLRAFIITNVIITVFFISMFFFLNGRYLMPMMLVLLLWIPFAIDYLYEKWRTFTTLSLYQKAIFPSIVAILSFMIIDGTFSFGYSKAYVKEAGYWLAESTPPETKVYTNLPQLLYFARGSVETWERDYDEYLNKIFSGGWREYDYLAIKLSRKHLGQEKKITRIVGRQPCKTFSNNGGSKVNIYCIEKPKVNS